MSEFEIALIEWPDGRAAGGCRVLGALDDPALVDQVRKGLASRQRRELARLEGPVRLVETEDDA